MNFDYFTSVGSPGALCRKADFERLTHLPFVKQMIDEYRAGNANAKKRLPHGASCIRASLDGVHGCGNGMGVVTGFIRSAGRMDH